MNNTLLSIILGIYGMVGWDIYDFWGGIFAKGIGSFRTLFWSQLVGAVAIALLALSTAPVVPTPSMLWLWLPVAAGCCSRLHLPLPGLCQRKHHDCGRYHEFVGGVYHHLRLCADGATPQ